MDVRVLSRFVNGQRAEFTEETQAVAAAFGEDPAEDAENARRVDPFRSARAQRTHDPGHERYSMPPFGVADRNLLSWLLITPGVSDRQAVRPGVRFSYLRTYKCAQSRYDVLMYDVQSGAWRGSFW